jgi:hypothetical protein
VATVLKTRGDYGAITFGNNIIGDRDINASPDDPLFQHEYGHYLRSKESGLGYFFEYGIPSLWYAAGHPSDEHQYYWTELDASKTGFLYFEDQYPSLNYWQYYRNPLFEEGNPSNYNYPVFDYGHKERPSTLTISKD